MIGWEQIHEFCDALVAEFAPEKVVLFGSYAYGQPTEDSDVDILVVLPYEGHPVSKMVEIRRKIEPHFPLDLLTYTPEQVRERLELGDVFLQEALSRGRVLYEAGRSRMGRKGRGRLQYR